jgi:hypothetical protein
LDGERVKGDPRLLMFGGSHRLDDEVVSSSHLCGSGGVSAASSSQARSGTRWGSAGRFSGLFVAVSHHFQDKTVGYCFGRKAL